MVKRSPNLLSVCLLLFACAGCSPKAWNGDEATAWFSADTLITFELDGTILPRADSLGDPNALVVAGQYLLVGDSKASRPLLVFDRDTGDYVTAGGALGEGPGEITTTSQFIFQPGQKHGWILNYRSRSLQSIDVDSLVLTGVLPDHRIGLESDGLVMSAAWSGSDSILTMGLHNGGRLAVFSADGSLARMTGLVPPGLVKTPEHVRQHAYRAMLKATSDGRKVVAACRHTDRIEIYEDRELTHLIRGPGFHDPQYKVYHNENGSWLGFEPNNISGYLSVSVTDDLIFGLYSGDEWGASQFDTAASVLVFTWDGRPLAVLQIRPGAFISAVSSDARELFVLYNSPAPLIMRYAVPPLM